MSVSDASSRNARNDQPFGLPNSVCAAIVAMNGQSNDAAIIHRNGTNVTPSATR